MRGFSRRYLVANGSRFRLRDFDPGDTAGLDAEKEARTKGGDEKIMNPEKIGVVGMELTGVAAVAFDDGRVIELREGALFHVPAAPHDSWVVGNEPYVFLHFLGAERYARKR